MRFPVKAAPLAGSLILLSTLATAQQTSFAGGLEEPQSGVAVRNDVHQGGREIVTLRYWRIQKGSADRFIEASLDGVWPYFEKIGARVIGMWRVIGRNGPPGQGDSEEPDYDEIYLATRYASVEHWRATRRAVEMGGDGPDWEKCQTALALRRSLTLETHVQFLEGTMAPNGPYFMPGMPVDLEQKTTDP